MKAKLEALEQLISFCSDQEKTKYSSRKKKKKEPEEAEDKEEE